jgi:1-acyl-sn-glycerol-3-phosphate acyltransferase
MRRLARFLFRVFFRRKAVFHGDRWPSEGPQVLVANHVNSLLDPLIVMAVAPRPVRFLAKAPLFSHPLVAPFLRSVRALPVHRRQDAGSDMKQNAATFEACERALAEGDAIALFPEGLSHNEPRLQPLKTGAARIVGRGLAAGARAALIPLGLNYSDKTAFRSDAVVWVGEPVPYEDLPWGEGEATEAVRLLTDRIGEGLSEVTVNAERWEDLRLIEGLRPLALELLGVPEDGLPPPAAQSDMLDSYYRAREERPAELKALVRKARPYLRTLRLLGLQDGDVVREVELGQALAYAWKRLAFLAVTWPPAFYGWLFHILPYRLTGPTALLLAPRHDVVATYKLYVGLFAFPLFYALQALVLWRALGPWLALSLSALAVPCGLWALKYYEAREEFFRLSWAVLSLRTRRGTLLKLRAMRSRVVGALAPLVNIYAPREAGGAGEE